MTDAERIELLEFKVAVLARQLADLTAGMARFAGSGLNKPVPPGLRSAIMEVANLGVSDAADAAISRVADHGFMQRAPKTVADLPDIIDL